MTANDLNELADNKALVLECSMSCGMSPAEAEEAYQAERRRVIDGIIYERLSPDYLVKALCAVDTAKDEWEYEVINLFDGVPYSTFADLDGRPGLYGYTINGKEWHWKLRYVRNNNRALFKVLDKG